MARRTSLLEKMRRTLKIAEKPEWREIWTMFKITLLGFVLIGGIGFIIQLISVLI